MTRRISRPRKAVAVKVLRHVVWLGKAREDLRRFLNDAQCWELEETTQRLEHFGDKRETWDLDVERVHEIDEVHVMYVCGSVFGSTVVELFFTPDAEGDILILGAMQGRPKTKPPWFRIEKMRNRRRHYLRR